MSFLLMHVTIPVMLAIFHIVGPAPADLGVNEGHLSPCPGPAHCASAQWQVADASEAIQRLATVINITPNTQIVDQGNNYLHATYSSKIFGFVDDLELYATNDLTLEARSISRIGESDLGVNEKRLKRLTETLKS